MMAEDGVENLRPLSRRGSANRIVCAVSNQRRCSGTCFLNNTRNIQRLLANVESVTKHPNLRELVAVRSVPLALRAKRNPLLPAKKIAQPSNGVLHRGNGAVEIACRMFHEWLWHKRRDAIVGTSG